LVDETLWFGQYQVRNGVAIDRDTETAGAGLLYDYEIVPADTRFRCKIVVENAEPWQLGMLLLGLAPFQQGEISVGGFRSRGLGWVKLEEPLQLHYFSLDGGNKVEQLIGYLQKPDQGRDVTQDEKQKWIKAFKDELNEAQKRAEEAAKKEAQDAQAID
ncbi:MAG: CRISPR-associated RAMP protein, partial [Chloroflexi bacterium]|nr:CRISPR-associated RAMP protein [Chloroflexota bacterium]